MRKLLLLTLLLTACGHSYVSGQHQELTTETEHEYQKGRGWAHCHINERGEKVCASGY